jgi:hypothetical protein
LGVNDTSVAMVIASNLSSLITYMWFHRFQDIKTSHSRVTPALNTLGLFQQVQTSDVEQSSDREETSKAPDMWLGTLRTQMQVAEEAQSSIIHHEIDQPLPASPRSTSFPVTKVPLSYTC